MSVRLFHRHTRLVLRTGSAGGSSVWYALHRRPIDWAGVLQPALLLVGFAPVATPGGLTFGDGGAVHWTEGALWTTIRLRLPPCSPRKAELLQAGLLKAARYAQNAGVPSCQA